MDTAGFASIDQPTVDEKATAILLILAFFSVSPTGAASSLRSQTSRRNQTTLRGRTLG